jgi:uncharacterized repeat protein (TIGR03803 family)
MKILKLLVVWTTLSVFLLVPCHGGQARFATLYTFGPLPGGQAPQGLTAGNGVLYGATYLGGAHNEGTIFQLQPPAGPTGGWTEAVLYSFGPTPDGGNPVTPPVVGAGGALYGATQGGGSAGSGTVYQLQPPTSPSGSWTEALLHNFTAQGDGGYPSGVLFGAGGALYGTASDGGPYDAGVVFQIQPPSVPGGSWTETVLYNFTGGTDGAVPASLIFDQQGGFFGTALFGGGSAYAGTIFELDPPSSPGNPWGFATFYTFAGGNDGCNPNSLTLASDGKLFGTTFGTFDEVGGFGVGSVFRFDNHNSFAPPSKSILRQFGYGNGWGPDSPVIVRGHQVFGAASRREGGVVFEMVPPPPNSPPQEPWQKIVLHHFTNGQTPSGPIVLDDHGVLYGTTYGPQQTGGTVYRIETQ